jgi:hypothetical protein
MYKNYIGRCIDCDNYGNCETIDELKSLYRKKQFEDYIETPKPCADYEYVGDDDVRI